MTNGEWRIADSLRSIFPNWYTDGHSLFVMSVQTDIQSVCKLNLSSLAYVGMTAPSHLIRSNAQFTKPGGDLVTTN